MDIDAAFKTDAQFAHACKPGMRALDDPAKTTQSVVALSIPLRAIREVIPRRLRELAGKASSNPSNTTESCRLSAQYVAIGQVLVWCRRLTGMPCSAQIQLLGPSWLGLQDLMQTVPDNRLLPITQPALAGHVVAIAAFYEKVLPRDARAKDIEDAVEGLLIADTRPSALRRTPYLRNQRWSGGHFEVLPPPSTWTL